MRSFLTCLVFCLAALPARAQVTTLDFETYPGPDGRLGTADDLPTPACTPACAPIGASYAAAGISFNSGTLFQGAFFPGSAATNHYVSSSPPDVSLSLPVYGVSVRSYSTWDAVLYAFDAGGTLIATATLPNPAAGSAFLLGTLSVATTTPIARFVVLEASCTVGGPACSRILNLDDFVLALAPIPTTPTGTPAPVAVPSSSTWSLLLMMLALGAIALSRLRQGVPRGG
jgi:hypothetical protein